MEFLLVSEVIIYGNDYDSKDPCSPCRLEYVEAGQLIEADLDLVLGNDITSPVAIHEIEKMKVEGVFDKDKIALVPDHFVPNKDIKMPIISSGFSADLRVSFLFMFI